MENNQLMSDSIDQLATALAKAQGEMFTAGKNQKNPFFKSSYADFEAIVNASRPALTKYGLSVVQPPVFSDTTGQSFLITILMHCSGQWIQSRALHNPQKNDIQSLSSYNTYLKRMCYTSLVGVATGEDDDGEAATIRDTRPVYQNSSQINEKQYNDMMALVNQFTDESHADFLLQYQAKSFVNFPPSRYNEFILRLKEELKN